MMNRSTRPSLSVLAVAALTSLVALSAGAALAAPAGDMPKPTRGVIKLAPDQTLDADTRFQRLANDYIEALWRLDPDAAIGAGRYEYAAELPAPDRAMRAHSLSFATDWLKRFEAVDAKTLSAASSPVADSEYTVPSALTAISRAAMPGTSARLICQLKPIGSKIVARPRPR